MPLTSMTGFARTAGADHAFNWLIEIKSVNNKGLDTRIRVPAFLDGFDLKLKRVVADSIARGSVFATLSVERDGQEDALHIDVARLKKIAEVALETAESLSLERPGVEGLMALKGVIEQRPCELIDGERTALEAAVLQGFTQCLDALKQDRQQEGARLEFVITAQIDEIEAHTAAARQRSEKRPDLIRQRFEDQLQRLLGPSKPVDDDRLAQEIALLVVKADISEELDRLDSHITEARRLLLSAEPVGRRFDFLCQELHREANTLCSKSADSELTRTALALKVVIDQLREQIQNIE